jgi:hypothetical protein
VLILASSRVHRVTRHRRPMRSMRMTCIGEHVGRTALTQHVVGEP